MTTTTNNPTRRAALLAIGSAGAIAAVPVAAIASRPAVDRSAWERTFAELQAIQKAYDAQSAIYDRIEPSHTAGRPSLDLIDWASGEFRFMDRHHVANVMDVEKYWQQFLDAEGKTWWAKNADATKARTRKALDSVLEYRRRDAENDEHYDWDGLNDKLDKLSDELSDAQTRLLKVPAPDGEALLWKLDHLFGEEQTGDYCDAWSMDLINPLLADARRLLSQGRA